VKLNVYLRRFERNNGDNSQQRDTGQKSRDFLHIRAPFGRPLVVTTQ
jgi:hypothetical protein